MITPYARDVQCWAAWALSEIELVQNRSLPRKRKENTMSLSVPQEQLTVAQGFLVA